LRTQADIVREVASDTGLAASVVKEVLASHEDVILGEVQAGQKVKIGQLVQLSPKIKPKTKKRMGRNPATGEEVEISAKPASVVLRARVLKRAKDHLPSIQKARKAGL
jgi:integration host factor subunit alpha